MDEQDFQKKVADAIRNPSNLGALEDADAVGTVGNPDCGEMLRMWIKFKEERGRKVIDQATFQSFGCETAIAVASLATQLIRGKTPEEALNLSGEQLAADLGPLPPMKIHCGRLVEEALRSALKSGGTQPAPSSEPKAGETTSLLDKFSQASKPARIVFLEPGREPGND